MTLTELNKEGPLFLTDKGNCHDYFPIYEELFAPFRDKEINLFEAGYWFGGSCELWKRYFPKAHIRSIDVNANPKRRKRFQLDLVQTFIPPSDRVRLDIMNVRDLTMYYFKDFIPDIAIDDGSHNIYDQLYFVGTVYPVLRQGGLLIVEDIQNINRDENKFRALDFPYVLVDQRKKTGLGDDVLLIFAK